MATLGTPITVPEPADVDPTPAPDTRPGKPAKRPTTRAGRAAAAAAKRGAKPDAAPARPKVTGRDVTASVAQLHTMAGAVLPILGMPHTGAALAASGDEAGKVWADVVRRYPQLERLFGAGTDGLVFFRLLMVYAPIVSLAVGERSAPRDPAAGPNPMDLLGMFSGVSTMAPTDGPRPPAYAGDPTAQDVPPGQNTGGRP